MRFKEFSTEKPLTPKQAGLGALKKRKDNVSKALDAERQRQQVAKAQQKMTKTRAVKP